MKTSASAFPQVLYTDQCLRWAYKASQNAAHNYDKHSKNSSTAFENSLFFRTAVADVLGMVASDVHIKKTSEDIPA